MTELRVVRDEETGSYGAFLIGPTAEMAMNMLNEASYLIRALSRMDPPTDAAEDVSPIVDAPASTTDAVSDASGAGAPAGASADTAKTADAASATASSDAGPVTLPIGSAATS
jgi:hypothetical protein